MGTFKNKISSIPAKKTNISNISNIDKSVKIGDGVISVDKNEFSCIDSLPGFLRKKLDNKEVKN